MLRHPFTGTVILTNAYRGDRIIYGSNLHYGEDYALNNRTAIIAAADGVVIATNSGEKRNWIANTPTDPFKPRFGSRALTTADYGNYIKIDHGDGYSSLYAHLDEVVVSNGMSVKEGQLIGYSDSTGNSTGNHIHWEVRLNNIVVDMNNFDYTKVLGKGGEQNKFYVKEITVRVKEDVDGLNVRSGPARTYKLSGSKILKPKDEVSVLGFVEGEEINGNKFWWESRLHNYFWSGGTDIIPSLDNVPPSVVDLTKGTKHMFNTQEEKDAKVAELKAQLAEAEAGEVTPVAEAPAEPVVEAAPVVEEAPAVVEEDPAKAARKVEYEALKAKMAELEALGI